jgi:hypothetical protein
MLRRYWLIRGVNCEPEFQMQVNIGQFGDRQIRELLRALAAKELNASETVGAYAKRGTKTANDLLRVQKGFDDPIYMCGCGVTVFTATVVDESGKPVKVQRTAFDKPKLTS